LGKKNAAVNTERMKHRDSEQNDAKEMVKNNYTDLACWLIAKFIHSFILNI